LQNTFSSKLTAITASVTAWGPLLAAAGTSAGNQLKNAVTSAVNTINLYQSGVNAVQGFINGAASQSASVYNTFYNIANAAQAAAKKSLAEASPSKAMFKIGAFATEGFINGAMSLEDELEKQVGSMYDGIVEGRALETSLTGALSAATLDNSFLGESSGGVVYNYNVEQNIEATKMSEYELQKEAEAMIRRLRWT